MRFQSIDVAKQSLANPLGTTTLPPEIYIPLWWYSGGQCPSSSNTTVPGNSFIARGATGIGTYSISDSRIQLHSLSSNWPVNTTFAFEISAWVTSGATGYASLWDLTSNTQVTSSQITSTTTTATVFRSSPFNLVPGHKYGISLWVASTGTLYITDASLIVYPNAQMLASGDLANITLGTLGQKLTESQIPLWVYSSGLAGSNATAPGSGSYALLQKGTTSLGSSSSGSARLHTLNSNWSPTQKFAFEASIWVTNSSITGYAALWDFTSGSVVSASQISIVGTGTPTLLRSGQFTLTPGHQYGVTAWINTSSSYSVNLTKAHLIPLFS